MEITKKNYELYSLDYIEGNLKGTLYKKFTHFLSNNPDIAEEIYSTNRIKLSSNKYNFSKKNHLYKNRYDLSDEFINASIAYTEGDLTCKEKTDFKNYLSIHPQKQKEAYIFGQIKLKANKKIIFEKKSSLYHTSRSSLVIWAIKIAAIFLLILTIFSIPEKDINITSKNIVKLTPPTIIKKAPITPILSPKISTDNTIELKIPKKQKQKNTKKIIETSHSKMPSKKRIPVKAPQILTPITISISPDQPDMSLIAMKETELNQKSFLSNIIDNNEIPDISLKNIAKTGLNLFSNISNIKIGYETNSVGKITELHFESKPLAFSFPTKNK